MDQPCAGEAEVRLLPADPDADDPVAVAVLDLEGAGLELVWLGLAHRSAPALGPLGSTLMYVPPVASAT